MVLHSKAFREPKCSVSLVDCTSLPVPRSYLTIAAPHQAAPEPQPLLTGSSLMTWAETQPVLRSGTVAADTTALLDGRDQKAPG